MNDYLILLYKNLLIYTYTREPSFIPSKILEDDGSRVVSQYRTSSSAYLKRQQTPIVQCIEQRFAQFQGFKDLKRMEPLQVVKYTSDQQV